MEQLSSYCRRHTKDHDHTDPSVYRLPLVPSIRVTLRGSETVIGERSRVPRLLIDFEKRFNLT